MEDFVEEGRVVNILENFILSIDDLCYLPIEILFPAKSVTDRVGRHRYRFQLLRVHLPAEA
jgi:hypothetical protein